MIFRAKKKILTIVGGAALLVSTVGCDDGVVATSARPAVTRTTAWSGVTAQPLPAAPESRTVGAGFNGCIIGLNCGCFPRQGKCGRQRSPRVAPPPPVPAPPGEYGNNGPVDGYVPVAP